MHKQSFKSGFVAIVGRPNAGKSTLMNCLLGEKVAIISKKPQTTRNKILGIFTDTNDDFQIVFIDTPGIHDPKTKLGEYMVKSAESAVFDVDCILFLVTITPKSDICDADKKIIEKLLKRNIPVILVINKIDLTQKPDVLDEINKYKDVGFSDIVPISALKQENTTELLKTLQKYLPYGPKYFPSDMVTDQPERQIVAEMIREKTLFLLQDEIPHGIAVEITVMKKRESKNIIDIIDIEATIYCEKDSHKGIVIGKSGQMLKNIGKSARIDIERFLGCKVYLQLWVKVKNNWRDSSSLVKNFGYDPKNI